MAPFSMMDIKLLCGVTAFKRGDDYHKSGRVTNLVVSEDEQHYDAIVRGTKRYKVKIDLDEAGEIEAFCDCPAYGTYYDYCKHVAAVLLTIHERWEQAKPAAQKTRGKAMRTVSGRRLRLAFLQELHLRRQEEKAHPAWGLW